MFCVECGNKMPDGVDFCSQCGAKMMNPQSRVNNHQQGSYTQPLGFKVPKILSENTREQIEQFSLNECFSVEYFFEDDISDCYHNDFETDEFIFCYLYLFDTGFLISSMPPISRLGRLLVNKTVTRIENLFVNKSGRIEFLYSDISKIEKLKLGQIKIHTKDGKQHRIEGDFDNKKSLYDLLLLKMNTTETAQFISPQYIINNSKLGEPMHDFYKSAFLYVNFFWVVVFIFVLSVHGGMGNSLDQSINFIMILLVYASNLGLTYLDENELKIRGISNGFINLSDILITPIYLYKREQLLDKEYSVLILWCVLILVLLSMFVNGVDVLLYFFGIE